MRLHFGVSVGRLFSCVQFVEVSSIFVFLEGDALVEGLGAFVACREEVETDTTNVLFCLEVLEIVNLLAFNLQFHHAPILQTNTITLTQMIINYALLSPSAIFQ